MEIGNKFPILIWDKINVGWNVIQGKQSNLLRLFGKNTNK